MNNEPLVPPPSSNSQPENFSSAGHDWNNGITRRSFLKRTGGATLATMVTWHGVVNRTYAEAVGNGGGWVVVEVTYTIPAGQSFVLPQGSSTPDNHPGYEQWAVKKLTKLNSSQSLDNWEADFGGAKPEKIGNMFVIWGPAVVRFWREIIYVIE
jgi:hypothetical protein